MSKVLRWVNAMTAVLLLSNCGNNDFKGTAVDEASFAPTSLAEGERERFECQSITSYADGSSKETTVSFDGVGLARARTVYLNASGRSTQFDSGLIPARYVPDQTGANALIAVNQDENAGFTVYSRSHLGLPRGNAKVAVFTGPQLRIWPGGSAQSTSLVVIAQDYATCN